ncbi:MAG TPA: hypothetical protein VEY07_04160, partial [Thermoplasmata archaeon]|nr:hypothetical protein [Thermoplasmata archaeon]
MSLRSLSGGPASSESRTLRIPGHWPAVVLVVLLVGTGLLGVSPSLGAATAVRSTVVHSPLDPIHSLSLAPSSFLAAPRAGAAVPSPAASQIASGTIVSNGSILRGNVQPWNLAVPMGIAYDPSSTSVWVSGAYSGSVGRYDAQNGTLLAGALTGTTAAYPTAYGGAATEVAWLSGHSEIAIASPSAAAVVLASDVTGTALTTIPLAVGSVPSGLAYDRADSYLFVTDQRLNLVWVLNLTSNLIQGFFSVGSQPSAAWYDSATGEVYVANYASSNVTIFNGSTWAIESWVHVGTGPVGFSQVGSRIWVLNKVSGNVTLISDSSRTSVGSVSFTGPGSANGLVYDSARNTIGVLNSPTGDLQLLNGTTGSSVATVVVGGTPFRGSYDPYHAEYDLTNIGRNTLDVVNDGSNAVTRSTVLGSAPMATFYDATTQYVYVADASVSWLSVLDARTNTVVSTIPLSAPGIDLAFAASVNTLAVVMSNGGVAFVNPGSGQVSGTWRLTNGSLLIHATYGNGEFFFTGGQPYGQVPFNDVFVVGASGFSELAAVGGGAYNSGIAYDPVNHYVYVATNTSLLVISSFSDNRVANYPIAGAIGLEGIAFSQASNAVVVADWSTGEVHVFNITTSSEDTRPVVTLANPGTVTYVVDTNSFYVASTATNTSLSLQDFGGGSYSLGTVFGGNGPAGFGYSQLSGLLYVSNAAGGTISLVQLGSSSALPMVVTLAIAPTTVAIGTSVTITAVATYPMWDDQFNYSGLPTGCPSRNASYFSCVPNETGSFQVTVSAQNPFHASASTSARFAVFAPLTVATFTATPAVFTLGLSTQIQVALAGGVQPLTVGYPVRPTGCGPTTSVNWSCRPTTNGTFTLEVTASDSAGHSVSQNLSIVVNPHLTITTFAPSVNTTLAGKPMVFTVVIAGGTGPYTFSYAGLPAGCSSVNASSVPCTPTASGVFPVVVHVTDSDGVSVSANTSLIVQGTGSTTSGGGLSTTDLLIVLAIVVVVAVAAVVLLATRRRGGAPPVAGGMPPSASAPSTPPAAEEPEELPEEMEGVTVVEAPPPEPLLPPSPAPAPASSPEPSGPRY